MLRPGDRLGERYRVIEQIAEGGMGSLWRAHHIQLDVDVALKVVSTRAASPGSLKRFKREAQAAAKLRSPHIVQVLDYGEFDGQPYLAMELLRGEDLAARLDRVGKLSLDDCLRVIDAVAKAVQVAHDAGIVHRDLKPANIFLETIGDDEIVKILDFGVAKDLAQAAEPGSTTGAGTVGSPAYMSPEQVWAHQVGNRTDVWAMGVVAFEMLTGKNPFFDETLARIFERIVREPLPKPSELAAGLPVELDAFFERALARSPKERIASAREFADAFRAALEGREAPPARVHDVHAKTQRAPPASQAAVTNRRRRAALGAPEDRSRRLLVLAGVAVVLIAAGVIAVSRAGGDKGPNEDDGARSKSALRGEQPDETGVVPSARPSAAIRAPAPAPPRASDSSTPPAAPAGSERDQTIRRARPQAPRSGSSAGSPKLDPKFGVPVNH